MKTTKFLYTLILFAAMALLQGCDGEKDFIVIEGDLPIKTSTLYIVGNATPAQWDIDNPVELQKSEEDHLVFIYEGPLTTGEMKAYLTTGNFDNPCIHPMTAASPISKANIDAEKFQLYSGGEDLKWDIKDAGNYRLVFNLRTWTLSTTYLGN